MPPLERHALLHRRQRLRRVGDRRGEPAHAVVALEAERVLDGVEARGIRAAGAEKAGEGGVLAQLAIKQTAELRQPRLHVITDKSQVTRYKRLSYGSRAFKLQVTKYKLRKKLQVTNG